jgi:hypothetical protein
MVAEGEELETNLLHATQRNPASSGVLDEVFGTLWKRQQNQLFL